MIGQKNETSRIKPVEKIVSTQRTRENRDGAAVVVGDSADE